MRARVWAALLAGILCGACSGSSACEQAGGLCSPPTPGACLGVMVGDPSQFPCDNSGVCCLPLSDSPCEKSGGRCVEPVSGACANGTVGDPGTYSCAANGAVFECCLPAPDAGP